MCESSGKGLTHWNSWVDVNHDTSDFGCTRRLAIAAETALPVSARRAGTSGPRRAGVGGNPDAGAGVPFTTLEEWLFWEDRPAYPWTCFSRLHFTGQLDRTAFEAAVREALGRHPLFSAKARFRDRMHLEWVVQEDPQPAIVWESGPVGGPFPAATPLNLFHEIGIRFHVVSDGRACDVVIQFHHACCDGIGFLTFLDDLLIAYTLALGTAPANLCLPALEPEKLASRNRLGLTLGKAIRMAPGQASALLQAARFLLRSPAPIVPHQPAGDDDPVPAGYPAVLSGVLDRQELSGLRKVAARDGAWLNDLLARELFLALAEWRARWNVPGDDEWLRLMIPMNLRTPADSRLPAASLASFVCLDRRRQDFEDSEHLLQGIHKEMSVAVDRQRGFTFVFSCGLVNLIPGRLKAHIRKSRCQVSTVLTNLGKCFARSPLPRRGGRLVVGDATLEGFDSAAPIRPYTCASFAATTYANRLTITLHYDPRPLTGPQAADLLTTFLTRLRTVQF